MLVLLLPSLEGNMRADGSRDQMKSPAINELHRTTSSAMPAYGWPCLSCHR